MTAEASDATSDATSDADGSSEQPRTVDHDAVTRVAKVVQIRTVRVIMLHGELNAHPPAGWSEDAYIFWDPSLSSRTDDMFTADLLFVARWRADWDRSETTEPPDYDPDDPPGVELAAEFELTYRLADPEGITDEDLTHFCVLNGTANAWPYWREAAQSVTARMGIEPLVVPVLPVPRFDVEVKPS